MSKKLIIIGIAIVGLMSCNQGAGNSSDQKNSLNMGEIDKIELMSNSSDESVPSDTKVLSKSESKRFVELWNSSSDSEGCQFHPEYKIHVWMKTGKKREFSLTDKVIKENNESCYSIDYKKLVKLIQD